MRMKRLEPEAAANGPTFIGMWRLEPPSLCDELIALFEANGDRHKPGVTYAGKSDANKKSTDLAIYPRLLGDENYAPVKRYIDALYSCYADYLVQWPYLENLGRMNIGPFNIQRYDAGGHFAQIHCERTSMSNSHRVLAWMTYLNDMPSGGSTCFPHYGLDVQPEKAKTLIWPAEWTHAHRGNVVTEGRKYIVTGWMHFAA